MNPEGRPLPHGAVVGFPIEHSLSPAIFLLFSKNLNRKIRYTARRVEPNALAAAFKELKDDETALGWNVTLPHKEAVLDLADKIEPSARRAGAANVIARLKGETRAYNTDGDGFLAPLLERGFTIPKARVLILGAGGAARGVAAALKERGVGSLCFLNRTRSRADVLAETFGGESDALKSAPALRRTLEADLIVNATSLGMDGKSSPLPEGVKFKTNTFVYDLVYRPLETPLLRAARAAGCPSLGGLAMLVSQAALTWKIWFEQSVPPGTLTKIRHEIERTPL